MDRPPHGQRPFSPFLREALGWLLALHLLLALMPSLHLEQTLHAGAQKARVLLKAADTVRRHAVPLGVQGFRAVMSG
ncbi:hypothetical protein D7X55_09370 [Corallococcus sp. AB049A]|uniref:hypothetical protein n=1 Tax=Corallococcus sp. AB049A TaxID=2316721 RepID=UPI000EA0A377|nr:hypothetical protein [Corallococcus sp. AB049A]RKH49918.1 hypothetical protein D7Y23_15140 [Corallococcus sp. AB050B]RKI71218.1 hypothetical protein D7X55_09370 [Corallococcus sp. AB049A]